MVTGESVRPGNDDYPWDKFDPVDYLDKNYATMRDDDRQILEFVRDFFVRTLSDSVDQAGLRGIDACTGPNLYPALTMLPFCHELTLFDYSRSNVDWLTSQQVDGWPSWQSVWADFWRALCEQPVYARVDRPDMGRELAGRVNIVWGSIFQLGQDIDVDYDVGTMFFGPESLTSRESEFHSAIDHFLHVLRPNAPFAIGLMEHSRGFTVGGSDFPATDIGMRDVTEYLSRRTVGLACERVGYGDQPLRDGYTGMLVVCGRIAP